MVVEDVRTALQTLAAHVVARLRDALTVVGIDLADGDAAVDRLRDQLAAGDAVLVKASRAARLDEVAAALA